MGRKSTQKGSSRNNCLGSEHFFVDLLETVCRDVSREFTDATFVEFLKRVGTEFGANCVRVFKNREFPDGELKAEERWFWAASDLNCGTELPGKRLYTYEELGLKQWQGKLSTREGIKVSRTQLGESLLFPKNQLKDKPVYVTPIFVDRKWWGILVLLDGQSEKLERINVIDWVRAAANLFGILLSMQRQEKEREEKQQDFHFIPGRQVDLCCRFKPDGTLFEVNPQYKSFLGDFEVEWSGKSFFSWMNKNERQRFEKLLRSATPQKPLILFEHPQRLPDGRLRWMAWIIHVCFDQKGHPVEYQAFVDDVTRQKQTEIEMRNQVERTRQILETTLDGFILGDQNGQIIDVNTSYCNMIGYSREELLKMNIRQVEVKIPPEEVGRRIEEMTRAGRDRFQTQHKRKDGKVLDLDVSISIMTVNNEPMVAAFVRDITAFKQAQKALTDSERRYRILFEKSPIPLWEEDFSELDLFLNELRKKGVADIEAYFQANPGALRECAKKVHIINVNSAVLALYEAETKEALIGRLESLFVQESYPAFAREVKALYEGQNQFQMEVEIDTLSGKRKIILLRLVRLTLPDSPESSSRVLVSTMDITPLKNIEQALREKIKQLSAVHQLGELITSTVVLDEVIQRVIESAKAAINPDIVLFYLKEGEILRLRGSFTGETMIDVKKAAVHKVGECLCGLAVANGQPIYSDDIFSDPRCTLPECKEAGIRSFAVIPLVYQDKILGIVGLGSLKERFFKKETPFLQAIAAEISIGLQNAMLFEQLHRHEKELEQKVKDRTEQLQAINRELNEFAYVVSHDLKAPLRGVGQLAQWLLKDYYEILDETAKTYLDLMQQRVHRLYDLIDGILRYSRVGRLQVNKENVPVRELVENLVESLEPPEHFRFEISDELPVIYADRTLLEQVFQNLISNAIKFNDKPEGVIKIGASEQGDFVEFSVQDNGPGIKEEHFDKIFKMFQTLQSQEEEEGTGIGLALVKKIVESSGGKIWLESQIGVGTTFYFTFPRG